MFNKLVNFARCEKVNAQDLGVLGYLFEEFWNCFRAILEAFALIMLFIEAYEIVTDDSIQLSFYLLIWLGSVCGVFWYFINGYFFAGFLQRSATLKIGGSDTTIEVKFGDFFEEHGVKVIAVNDFFDDSVDDIIIAKNSIHGQTLERYWHSADQNWYSGILLDLKKCTSVDVPRDAGRTKRFEVGATAYLTTGSHGFLFSVLSRTDAVTHLTKASISDLSTCISALLIKARTCCANSPLVIPLIGSGLARVGLPVGAILDLILSSIVAEAKVSKVTGKIVIVLPNELSGKLKLHSFFENWK